jgi:phage baseplate assembly protein W
MAIVINKINPLDLQNIGIGVRLPFNNGLKGYAPYTNNIADYTDFIRLEGSSTPFKSTYETKEQIKYNLINLLLTNPGERIMNPEFGCGLRKALFEQITENTENYIKQLITNSINIYIPNIEVDQILIEPDVNNNLLNLFLTYTLKLTQEGDQVTLQFIGNDGQ